MVLVSGGSVEDLRAKDDLVKHLQGFRPAQTVLETSKADAGSAAAQQAQLAAGGKKKRKRNQLLLTVGARRAHRRGAREGQAS